VRQLRHGAPPRNPSSTFSTWWGTIGVLLLSYDFVVIPLRFVGLGESSLLTIMFWIAHLQLEAAMLSWNGQ